MATQGMPELPVWVKEYALEFSNNGHIWADYTEEGHEKVLYMNTRRILSLGHFHDYLRLAMLDCRTTLDTLSSNVFVSLVTYPKWMLSRDSTINFDDLLTIHHKKI